MQTSGCAQRRLVGLESTAIKLIIETVECNCTLTSTARWFRVFSVKHDIVLGEFGLGGDVGRTKVGLLKS